MAKLKDKIKTTLDEARMLILGSQVLLGFQFRSTLEKGFEKLPEHAKLIKLCGLALMIIAVMLLMTPGAFYRIVEDGEDTPAVNRFSTRVMCVALLPLALGLAGDFFIAAERLYGRTQGVVVGIIALAFALFFWYGIEFFKARGRVEMKNEDSERDEKEQGTELKAKIEQVLTEVRVVLPGAQALLGFQFAALLMEGFEKLPQSSILIHFISLSFVALAIIFMMTPAAYHRIVEHGEDTQRFHRFASHMLLASMIPLALGVSGDFFIVARKILHSTATAAALFAVALCAFYGLWFGYTYYRRLQSEPRAAKELKAKYSH